MFTCGDGAAAFGVSFAKSPASFKISKIPQRRVTCYLDEFRRRTQLLRSRGFELTVSTGVLSCNALVSRMSSEKSFVTILAAIRSQEKKRENGPLQEVLPVRSSHIRTMTLRASSCCSPHKTELYLVPERRKSARKMGNCLGSQPGRTDPLSQRLRAIARCSGPVSLDNLLHIDQRRTRLASSGRMNAPLP